MISLLMAAALLLQADDFPFGPIDQRAHGAFQLSTSDFVPDVPTSLKDGEILFHGAVASINVLNAPKELYVADMEFERLNLNCWYGVTDRFELGVRASYEWVNGGFQDDLIAGFHHTFGLNLGSRDEFKRGNTNLSINGQPNSLRPSGGFGDVMVLGNYQICKTGEFPGWSVGFQYKLPTSSGLYDNDRLGVGVMTNIFYQVGDWYFNAGFSVAAVDGSVFGRELKLMQDSGFFMVEYRICDWLSTVAQAVLQSGPIKDLGQYSRWSYEFDGGFKIVLSKHVMVDLGFFENAIKYDNSADFGLFTGLTLRW